MSARKDLWIFGYGSLIWKAPFDCEERCEGVIKGFVRRFYQSSWDHRGTRESPGRVVNIFSANEFKEYKMHGTGDANELIVVGAAYRIAAENVDQVLAYLDHREKAGYERHEVPVFSRSDLSKVMIDEALVYRGTVENEDFAGVESLQTIANIIATSVGPSGANDVYLRMLHKALHRMGAADAHIDELVALVDKLQSTEQSSQRC
jgi:glutathione-specific gamma-glutamylcyclotransferase